MTILLSTQTQRLVDERGRAATDYTETRILTSDETIEICIKRNERTIVARYHFYPFTLALVQPHASWLSYYAVRARIPALHLGSFASRQALAITGLTDELYELLSKEGYRYNAPGHEAQWVKEAECWVVACKGTAEQYLPFQNIVDVVEWGTRTTTLFDAESLTELLTYEAKWTSLTLKDLVIELMSQGFKGQATSPVVSLLLNALQGVPLEATLVDFINSFL